MADEISNGSTDVDGALTAAGNWLLRSRDSTAGGWAARKGNQPSPLNTAEALLAINQIRDYLPLSGEAVRAAVKFLRRQQMTQGEHAGAWFRDVGGEPRCADLVRTSLAVEALVGVSAADPSAEVTRGVTWLLSVRNADGGWGYRPGASSRILPTCFATSALLSVASAQAVECGGPIEGALAFLLRHQRPNGSLGDDNALRGVRTAFAALCLQRAELCKLRADRDARERAVAWLERNPVAALREVEDTIEIDPQRDDPQADYGFLFMSEAPRLS